MQLIKPVSGEVIFNNTNLVGLSKSLLHPFRKKMQMIFQDPYSSLNPRMTVEQILTEPLVIHEASLSSEEKKSRVLYLLKRVGLGEEHLRRYPHEFSGGQRQRICIARALVLKPEFIVCDESVSALDVSVQAQVLNLLLDLQDEFGLSYVFISHNLSVVNFMSDQVAVMNNGKIVEQSSSSELYLNPQNDYTKKLLSAIL
jgi:peptide/nickel transport system ATP-binding protein